MTSLSLLGQSHSCTGCWCLSLIYLFLWFTTIIQPIQDRYHPLGHLHHVGLHVHNIPRCRRFQEWGYHQLVHHVEGGKGPLGYGDPLRPLCVRCYSWTSQGEARYHFPSISPSELNLLPGQATPSVSPLWMVSVRGRCCVQRWGPSCPMGWVVQSMGS